MSAPTVLSPWYTVFKEVNDELVWYQSEYSEDRDEKGEVYTFSPDKRGALLFHSLHSAKRIADPQGAMIRVLVTEAEAKEFDRA